MSFSFSLFLPSVFSFPCRRSKGARVPETPCLFRNQTAVFLKCSEIDCALESAKKPRTAGLCGRAAGACDCGPLSCSTIERVNKGLKLPKQGMVRRKNSLPQRLISPSSERYLQGSLKHRPQTPQRSLQWALAGTHSTPVPKRAHSATQGEWCGETRSRPARHI